MTKIKGYTVHAPTDGNRGTECGVDPRPFMGRPSISRDIRRVTCPKCEKAILKRHEVTRVSA